MPRGGKRKGAGRKKLERPTDGNIARKIKAQINAEEKWLLIIKLATEKAKKTHNTADLRHCLEYLDDRDLGRCVDTVNHLHDKPIQLDVNLNLAERIASARKKLQR